MNLSSLRDASARTCSYRLPGTVHVLLGWLALGLLLPLTAEAGGLYANELSTTSQGNAGAGRGAWVPDASATLHNPASMTELDDHGFAGGLSASSATSSSTPRALRPAVNRSGSNQVGFAALPSFSYAHKVSDRVRLGLSFYAPAGSALDPNDSWAGRFQMTEISLVTLSRLADHRSPR